MKADPKPAVDPPVLLLPSRSRHSSMRGHLHIDRGRNGCPIAGTATGGAALQLAQPYGYRICHEDEKNPSAISMRILQTSR
jgi:hypothetical protein